ncbi:nitrogenase molybdenum-iron protein subunit beta [Novipirellula artificiosorum]|uniref:Nitrogenase molybdenum-iron protein beta chain n=1 Tax=Novipirellula artificiosorum TaxID=2528016 RepID=A0A5C6E4A9_9BACT|nr:nitrogenase molybdenum-iron protein subunit beta [Novipirellula artificiosorum]TWU42266.1 Nitrogenase molybdenum-iron protein beta chain [Novipirellula artificiosorum]
MALLRHTTDDVIERQALTVNPAKTCQPIGAMYAALGIHRCLPHSHGSQGCCSYHRSTLSRHYKEPAMAATSSFTEGSSVFGGQANLLQAINTIFSVYDPDVIAVHTTCLSETIGDDIPQIAETANNKGLIPEGKKIIHANTPSYVGAHTTGFANMTKAMVDYFATSTTEEKVEGQINLIPGWVEPADMREMKRIVKMMGLEGITFPDTSDVLDAPLRAEYKMYPDGGTTVEQLAATGDSSGTIALGPVCSGPAAEALKAKCQVPEDTLPLPIGLRATDIFVQHLRKYNGGEVPEAITAERGRLVDMVSDMSQYFYGKTVALWGDPDQLVSLTQFLVDLDMRPKYIITGTPGKVFLRRIAEVLGEEDVKKVVVKQGPQADMFYMHQLIKREKVDLLIGNTYGKYISRDEDIPLIRHGFPIIDRVGHQYFPTCGYRGAIRLCEKILDAFLDRQDRDSPEESFELTM